MEWSWPEVSETILGSSVNTVFVDNSATVVGGGVAYRGDGVGGFLVANCTFEGNTAAIRGGAVNYIGHEQAGSDPQQLVNNIFWNDSAPIGPEIGSMDSAGVTELPLAVDDNDIQGGCDTSLPNVITCGTDRRRYKQVRSTDPAAS